MIRDTQLNPDWEKKFDPPTIDRLPRMKWSTIVVKLAHFIGRMTNDVNAGCRSCPAEKQCDHCDCGHGIEIWARNMRGCEWDD